MSAEQVEHRSDTLDFSHVTDLGGGTLIGGYLILNALGRPLEFHCTEPVKPNRAQQILFGATLDAYLYGEQIAQTLIGHSELRPQLLVTDQQVVLTVRSFVEIPMIWLESATPPRLRRNSIGAQSVMVDLRVSRGLQRIVRLYEQALPEWNLAEPFQRIHEAITELQKAA